MILVIDPAAVKNQVETGLCHSAKEMGLCKPDGMHNFHTFLIFLVYNPGHQVVKMRKKIIIKHKFCTFALIIAGLVWCKFLTDIHYTTFYRLTLALLKVLHHKCENFLIG